MKCPNCNKESACGCNSCRKNKIDIKRFYFVNGDFIKCPHCGSIKHVEEWENYYYKNNRNDDNN